MGAQRQALEDEYGCGQDGVVAASIEDVARRAGVSIATVSRSLRGLPDVADATRDRVLVAARELEYVASPFAARLASGRTHTIGVILPFLNRWFFSETLAAIEGVLQAAGLDLLLFNLADEDRRARFFEQLPIRKRVDAVLLASMNLRPAEVEALRSLGLPAGIVGVRTEGFLSTRIDDELGSYLATCHLIERGHRDIGLVGGDLNDPMRFAPPYLRRSGFQRALAEAHLEARPEAQAVGYYTVEGGARAAHRILSTPSRPTAIVAESDEMAYGVLRTAARLGLRVPQDLAVIGFDDHSFAELLDLSTVRQPVAAQAIDLASRLVSAIGTQTGTPAPLEDVQLPVELVVRGSTDPGASTR